MEEKQVKETGLQRFHRLQAEAKKLGIKTSLSADELTAAIEAKRTPEAPKTGLTAEQAKGVEVRMRQEFEIQEKLRAEITREKERASLVVESESLRIPIELPENPTELELAKARQALGMKKAEVKPSPETVGIETSKRGYYIFTNLEQDDASHTVNLGGKYIIHLIPDQIHVLSEYHIKTWRRIAVTPVYTRVSTGVLAAGQMGEECVKTGGKRRFSFEYLGEAPQNAQFGLVTNTKILDELNPNER